MVTPNFFPDQSSTSNFVGSSGSNPVFKHQGNDAYHGPNGAAQQFVNPYQNQASSYGYPSSYHSVYPSYYSSNPSLIPNVYGNSFGMAAPAQSGPHFLPGVENVAGAGQVDIQSHAAEGKDDKAHFTLMLAHLARFKAEHGHCRVPRVYPANPQLGIWAHTIRQQRMQHRLHKTSNMLDNGHGQFSMNPYGNTDGNLGPDQVSFLDSIGFDWSMENDGSHFPAQNSFHSLAMGQMRPDSKVQSLSGYPENNDSAWNERFAALAKFKSQFGHCMVPARYAADPRLGHWVMTQRRQFHLMRKSRPSSMTLERISKLESLEFAWSIRMEPEKMWKMRYDELRRYKAAFGDCLVPQRFSVNPKLGTWVNTQRRHYKLLKEGKHSCMTQERIKLLEDLGFAWSTTSFNIKQENNGEENSLKSTKPTEDESDRSVQSSIPKGDVEP